MKIFCETSSTAVEWTLSKLLKNPKSIEKVQAEIRSAFDEKQTIDETGLHELPYLKSVIKETLRLHPPAPLLLPRECGEECEINGYQIPIKSRIIVNAWAIGRDPKHWNEAERYIPFGARRRVCPGIAFAFLNIELPIAQFLYHFDSELPERMKGEELDMEEVFGVTVRRKFSVRYREQRTWPMSTFMTLIVICQYIFGAESERSSTVVDHR
ncbi:unspecific monooxygenase [Sarracenia purpurea var. burkii]